MLTLCSYFQFLLTFFSIPYLGFIWKVFLIFYFVFCRPYSEMILSAAFSGESLLTNTRFRTPIAAKISAAQSSVLMISRHSCKWASNFCLLFSVFIIGNVCFNFSLGRAVLFKLVGEECLYQFFSYLTSRSKRSQTCNVRIVA